MLRREPSPRIGRTTGKGAEGSDSRGVVGGAGFEVVAQVPEGAVVRGVDGCRGAASPWTSTASWRSVRWRGEGQRGRRVFDAETLRRGGKREKCRAGSRHRASGGRQVRARKAPI